jgi:hypothetical protein
MAIPSQRTCLKFDFTDNMLRSRQHRYKKGLRQKSLPFGSILRVHKDIISLTPRLPLG